MTRSASNSLSRTETMSTAPASKKLAMFEQKGKAVDGPEIVRPSARIKGTVSAVGAVRCMTTRADVKPGRGRKFNKNADGLPSARSLADLP